MRVARPGRTNRVRGFLDVTSAKLAPRLMLLGPPEGFSALELNGAAAAAHLLRSA